MFKRKNIINNSNKINKLYIILKTNRNIDSFLRFNKSNNCLFHFYFFNLFNNDIILKQFKKHITLTIIKLKEFKLYFKNFKRTIFIKSFIYIKTIFLKY